MDVLLVLHLTAAAVFVVVTVAGDVVEFVAAAETAVGIVRLQRAHAVVVKCQSYTLAGSAGVIMVARYLPLLSLLLNEKLEL